MLTSGQRERIERYLAALERALGPTPAEERIEVVAGVREHIESALADLDEPADADVDAVLRQLGDPLTIAAAAAGTEPAPVARAQALAASWVPTAVVLLLGAGPVLLFLVLFFPVLLLLWVAGVALLWASPLWRVGEKVWGTLVPLASVIVVAGMSSISVGSGQSCSASSEYPEPVCTGGPSPVVTGLAWAVLVAIVAAVGWTLFVLWRRGMRRVPKAGRPQRDGRPSVRRGV